MSISEIIIISVVTLCVVALIITIIGRVRRRRGRSSAGAGDNTQVYVGNLAYRVNEFQVKEFFAKYGRINDLKIVRDSRTRRSKGYGFVTYGASSEAARALAANGESFKGRILVVRIAKQREV